MGAVPELSLVIPCYNEQDNLRALLKAIHEAKVHTSWINPNTDPVIAPPAAAAAAAPSQAQ